MQIVLSDPIGKGGPYKSHVMRGPEHDESVLCGFEPPPWMRSGWPNRATVELADIERDHAQRRSWQRHVCSNCVRILMARTNRQQGRGKG